MVTLHYKLQLVSVCRGKIPPKKKARVIPHKIILLLKIKDSDLRLNVQTKDRQKNKYYDDLIRSRRLNEGWVRRGEWRRITSFDTERSITT